MINDKMLPWRMAKAREAFLAPLITSSVAFQVFLATWLEAMFPTGNPRKDEV